LLDFPTLAQITTYDYLSASFGTTVKLTQFWQKQMFEMIGLGLKKDKASGLHSQFSVYACSETVKTLLKKAQCEFKSQLNHQLMADFIQLDTSLVMALVRQLSFEQTDFPKGYLTDQPYEAISYQLRNWLLSHSERLDSLPTEDAHWMIQKVLQNHPWQNRQQTEKCLRRLNRP
jgi:tRNA(Met) cytidine acetyltransferase